MGSGRAGEKRTADLLILIPVFDDWSSLGLLLTRLDGLLADAGRSADVMIVDDASIEPVGTQLSQAFSALSRIDVLRLRRNLGHQRAIAIGLAYCQEHVDSGSLVLMDGDGEDDPADVLRLADECTASEPPRIVFAERERRSEGLLFRVFYLLFKVGHRVLTGRRVRVGNFSCIPGALLSRLVVVSELWNHYAAAVMKARLPTGMIPTHRASRLAGRSTMNFTSLVTHGLSAISVFADVVGVRLLMATSVLISLTLAAMGTVVFVRFGTGLAIPGWATTAVGLLVVVAMQLVSTGVVLIFVTLGGRQATHFIPIRDYAWFCEDCHEVVQRTMGESDYVGDELELFAHATHWKSYLRQVLAPYLGQRVLEVGSGFGGTTKALCDGTQESWLCLEPDRDLMAQLEAQLAAGELPACCRGRNGTLADLEGEGVGFDTILYVDVLEHIDDDAGELRAAAELLEPEGHLLVLSPAHQWLYSPFDAAIGHFRRHDRRSYAAIAPPGLSCKRIAYLDSVGLLASAANRFILKRPLPTLAQILTWDRRMVPLSRLIDPLLFHRVGKSILGVWQRPAG